MKTKIKSHGDKLQNPKEDSNHTCLAVISLNSALKNDENYYSQVFLKGCKYIEKRVIRHITQDIEIYSSDSDEEWFFSLRNM